MGAVFGSLYSLVLFTSRILLPIITVLILVTWIKHFRYTIYSSHVLAALVTEDGERVPITSYESSIGRQGINDIVIPLRTVSRTHAVLTRVRGGFRISDTHSTGGIKVNGEEVEGSTVVRYGDWIDISGSLLQLCRPTVEDNMAIEVDEDEQYDGGSPSDFSLLMLLSLFQIILGVQLCLRYIDDLPMSIPLSIGAFIVIEWIYYFVQKNILNSRFLIETLVFYLATLSVAVCATVNHGSIIKQFAAAVMGLVGFALFTMLLCKISLTLKLRHPAAIFALALLVLNILLGTVSHGAKNWINLGFISFQPSEFVKVAFVFAGAATLERLLTTRNLTLFLGFSGAIMLIIVYLRDFGAVATFFAVMMIIIIMRLGDMKVVVGLLAASGIGGSLVLYFVPYVSRRFEIWRHAWSDPVDKGFQQTRTMIATASGGLLGLGGGNGNLNTVFAADQDLAFGIVGEEWGGIIAIFAICVFVLLAFYAVRLAKNAKSAYYSISVCAASGMFLFQMMLHVFGTLDILPLTGITLPFVSNGGSSMLASFLMLAFFKAAEIQQVYIVERE